MNKVFANSSLFIPIAAAKDSCWILFILPNSAALPACLAISEATIAILLFKAAVLAFSKFNSLPVSNSASISADMDASKFNKPEEIDSILLNSIPKDLAVATALPINPGFWPNDNVVAADTLPIPLSKSFSFNKAPFFIPASFAWVINSPVTSSISLPVEVVIAAIPCNSSFVNPAISLISVNWTKRSLSMVLTDTPKALLILRNDSLIFAPVRKIFSELTAIWPISLLTSIASL